MLITKKNFAQFLDAVRDEKEIGYDTETVTLQWWESPWHNIKPRCFAAQFATAHHAYYLDFEHSDDKLDESHWVILQTELFSKEDITWFIANAKFDLHQSRNHKVYIAGRVHCTKSTARICLNVEPELSLDSLGEKYLATPKIDILTYIKENGLLTKIKKFGNNDKFEELLHFDRVPLAMGVEYGLKDVRMAFDLGKWQLREIARIDAMLAEHKSSYFGDVKLSRVYENECKLTKVCFEMEREGILVDMEYTKEAYAHEVAEYQRLEIELDALAKQHLEEKIDWGSAKQLKKIFDALGQEYSYTEKGNATFDKDALQANDSELAKLILKYRYHNKRAHTYFENYIWMADKDGILHVDLQPAGTITGRMSCWSPNLQNVPKRNDKEEQSFKVRKCFIPRPGHFFADSDYKAAEYCMMFDYAREMALVEKVNAGWDVHEATGAEVGITNDRTLVKNINFGMLYGQGAASLSKVLKKSLDDTKEFMRGYGFRLPNVEALIAGIRGTAKKRGYVITWLGRVLTVVNSGGFKVETWFKSPNAVIQGGVGDMCKVAMVNVAENVLPNFKTKMLLQVHDALLFEIPFGEEKVLEEIKIQMEKAYPHRVLQIKTDVQYSAKSWGDLQSELPAHSLEA